MTTGKCGLPFSIICAAAAEGSAQSCCRSFAFYRLRQPASQRIHGDVIPPFVVNGTTLSSITTENLAACQPLSSLPSSFIGRTLPQRKRSYRTRLPGKARIVSSSSSSSSPLGVGNAFRQDVSTAFGWMGRREAAAADDSPRATAYTVYPSRESINHLFAGAVPSNLDAEAFIRTTTTHWHL